VNDIYLYVNSREKIVSTHSSIVLEKVRTSRTGVNAFPALAQVASAFGKSTSECMHEMLGIVVQAEVSEYTILRYSDYLNQFPEKVNLAIVHLKEVDGLAMINISNEISNHVVDILMGGDPIEVPEYVYRPPTTLDNALCTIFFNKILEGLRNVIALTCEGKDLGSMRCVRFEQTPILANITPEHSEVLVFRMKARIGEHKGDAREGLFEIALPLANIDPIKNALQKHSSMRTQTNSDMWQKHMIEAVLKNQLEVISVVDVLKFSVAEVSRMQVGDVLELNSGVLANISLNVEMGENDFVALAKGKLGTFRQHKAVKISNVEDEGFTRPLLTLCQTMGVG
jgi:flagellar motor switch protein FliM